MGATKKEKLCVCGKTKHKSKGAARAQMRAIIKRNWQRTDDWKDLSTLGVYRCRRNKFEDVWHVGHSSDGSR